MTITDNTGNGMAFAFAGRCSTEDNQDPESSRAWQLSRATTLIQPHNGHVLVEYFDIGQSRSLPWKRRPKSAELLDALRSPNRGFDAVVIGEPHRMFYGNQFGLIFPLFVHYSVELWVPEVGGRIDPNSDAHDMMMLLAECAKWSDGFIRPDALGVWQENSTRVEFFLEYDRGTETLGRLVDKLRYYEKFEIERGVSSWVLFMFESERREQRARDALSAATVPIATASVVRPRDAVWLPLTTPTDRLRLADLSDVAFPPAAVERAAKNNVRSWRYDRSRHV